MAWNWKDDFNQKYMDDGTFAVYVEPIWERGNANPKDKLFVSYCMNLAATPY